MRLAHRSAGDASPIGAILGCPLEEALVSAFTPDFEDWLRKERAWAAHALGAIARQRASAEEQTTGLDRFSGRMALVRLTGSIAAWSNGLAGGLEKVGEGSSAARFSASPPFAPADSREVAYDALCDYVEARAAALDELLDPGR